MDTGCYLEDLPRAMAGREERERVKRIRTVDNDIYYARKNVLLKEEKQQK